MFKIFRISLIFPSKFINIGEMFAVSVENFIPRTWKIPGFQQKFMSLRNRTFEFFLLPIHTSCVLSLFNSNPEKRANFLSVCILSWNDSSLPTKQSVVSSAKCDNSTFIWFILIPLILLFSQIIFDNISSHIKYKLGDSGPLCLTPLPIFNQLE